MTKSEKRELTSVILPSIRKCGMYVQNQEEMTPDELMATAVKVAKSILAEKEDIHH